MPLDVESTAVQLIDLVYACLLGEAEWQHFLDRLSGVLPGGKSVFMFHDTLRNTGMFSLTSGIDQSIMRDYERHYSARNPWVKRVMSLPVGVGIVSDQMCDRDEFLKSEFYSDYLPQIDCRSCIGITVVREPERALMISTLTRNGDSMLNASGATVMTCLQPHLERAIGHYRALPVRSRSDQMSMLDAAGIGLLVVGAGMRMVSANSVAMELLLKGEVCSVTPMGRHTIRDADANIVLRQMLAMGSPILRHFTYYEKTGSGQAKVTLVRLNKDPVAEFFAGPTVAILIDVIGMEVGELAGNLLSRYGLTSAEGRLAQALDRGASVKEAAAAFGISEGTARQQLKAIFRKIGIVRQSELIRSLHDPTFTPNK